MPESARASARRRRPGFGVWILAASIQCWAVLAARGGEARTDEGLGWAMGPLFQTFPLVRDKGEGTEALGPLFYEYHGEEASIWGVPPFVSSYTSNDGEDSEVFVLPPLFTWRRHGSDVHWQLGQWINGTRQELLEDPNVRRTTLFPVYFSQKSSDPSKDYWALFPLYGTLRNRMFRDEATFTLFPLWLKTRKGTMTTRNVLFPIIHVRDGPGLHGWQVWPLAGHEHREPTMRTNLAEELEVAPGHDKTFVLWPVYFRNRLGLGTDNPTKVDAVFPLFYQERSPRRDSTSLLGPLVSWTDDRGQGYRQWYAPWPLISFARGEGRTLDRVLPFFSVGHNRTLTSESYLWPIYRHRHLKTEDLDRDRLQLGMFLYSDVHERIRGTDITNRRIDSWPLFTWSRDRDHYERLQVLALFEGIRGRSIIERNWSPLWSLWRQERNLKTGAHSQSLLWNLYRQDASPEVTKGSLLFGLVQYQKTSAGRRWRWLYMGHPLKTNMPPADPPSDVRKHR